MAAIAGFLASVIIDRIKRLRKRNKVRLELEGELFDEFMDECEELCLVRSYEVQFKVERYTEEYLPRYSEKFFFRAHRMQRITFTKLLRVVCSKGAFEPENLRGKKAIPAEKRLLITLRYLATKKTVFEIAEMFNVAESTAWNVIEKTLDFLDDLQSYVIIWPGQEDAPKISDEFKAVCDIEGALGSLDGSHVEAKIPAIHRADFTNRKFRQSVILLAVFTYSKLFTYIYAGIPGRAHDARVLKNSTLWHKVEDLRLDMFYGNYFLLCDSAFLLKIWAMCPFRRYDGQPAEERLFNTHLSKGRVCIENSFGWLKGRFKRLKYIDVDSLEKIPRIINGCCTLHNFCIIEHDLLPPHMVAHEEQVPVEDYENLFGDVPADAAVLKRQALMQTVVQ